MEWMLVLYIYAGVWANGASVAITTVPMASLTACEKAGQSADSLVNGTRNHVRYICVKTS